MIDQLKSLFGPDRLRLLAAMPNVSERGTLDAFLQAACAGAAGPAQARVNALRAAGSIPTPDDLAAAEEESQT